MNLRVLFCLLLIPASVMGPAKAQDQEMDEFDELPVPVSAVSFADLDKEAETRRVANTMRARTMQYNDLVTNIIAAPAEAVPDKAVALEALTAEFIAVLALAPEPPGVEVEVVAAEFAESATGNGVGLSFRSAAQRARRAGARGGLVAAARQVRAAAVGRPHDAGTHDGSAIRTPKSA